jgi:hypothetical protein
MAEEKMAQSEPTITPIKQRIDLVKPEDGIARFYANHVQIGRTAFDVRLVFGTVTDVNDERVQVTQEAQVTISWLEAKVLAEFLKRHVEEFEKGNGPIMTEFAPVSPVLAPDFPKIRAAK